MKLVLVALLLLPASALAQRDSTICVAFRTRTSATGAILSTSVTKVRCGATVTVVRRDTVKVPVPGPIQYVRVTDTLTVPCPVCTTLPPAGALTTRDRSPYLTDVFASGIHLGYVGASGVTWMAWRRLSFTPDSIEMDRVSYPSQAEAIDALTKPYTGPTYPAAIMPELPRVYLDTRMPPAPAPGGVVIVVPP